LLFDELTTKRSTPKRAKFFFDANKVFGAKKENIRQRGPVQIPEPASGLGQRPGLSAERAWPISPPAVVVFIPWSVFGAAASLLGGLVLDRME
jgi:hypothetical protein